MGRSQRYCTKCGRQMIPFESSRYPYDEWLGCPRWLSVFHGLFGDGLRHDVAIIGEHKAKFDPVTGQPVLEGKMRCETH